MAPQACLVPTSETVRIRYFMDRLLERRRPIMLVGNAGTGKSVLVGDKLSSLDSDKYVIKNVPFNFYTTSAMLQGREAHRPWALFFFFFSLLYFLWLFPTFMFLPVLPQVDLICYFHAPALDLDVCKHLKQHYDPAQPFFLSKYFFFSLDLLLKRIYGLPRVAWLDSMPKIEREYIRQF